MIRRFHFLCPARGRRGSVFILVVALLAVLGLLTMTLAYGTKVDLLAARNWASAVQDRMDVATHAAQFSLTSAPASASGALTFGAAQALVGDALSSGSSQFAPLPIRLSQAGLSQTQTISYSQAASASSSPAAPAAADAATTLTVSAVEDESAKLNLNAIVPQSAIPAPSAQTGALSAATRESLRPGYLSETVLAGFITSTLTARGVGGVDAQALAHAIAMRRFGANAKPDFKEAAATSLAWAGTLDAARLSQQLLSEQQAMLSDPGRMAADPREVPAGDDRPFATVDELMGLAGMTQPAYQALASYLTVCSVSFAAFDLADPAHPELQNANLGFPQVDPNTAPAQALYEVLRRRFPKAPEAQLGQFVANMIDRRDTDTLPTTVQIGGNTYYGMEINPCINEVCPVVSYDDTAGEGQYVELFNPWSTTMNLDNWSLQGAGSVALSGSLPPGGYLVITNDNNNENDPNWKEQDQNGNGSFYNVFHVVATDSTKQLKEASALALPAQTGKIQLVNAEGRVVDEFSYANYQFNGTLRSFQRRDPRLRASELGTATPLAPNLGLTFGDDATQILKMQEKWQNQPFRSPLDVMLVSSSYAAASADAASSATTTLGADATPGGAAGVSPFALPPLQASEGAGLDVRLVDCFRLGARMPSEVAMDLARMTAAAAAASTATGASAAGAGSTPTASPPPPTSLALRPRCDKIFGRLNLNTAPLATLAVLPGMDGALLGRVDQARQGLASGGAPAAKTPTAPTAQDAQWWTAVDPRQTPHWRNLSDFILDEDVWQGRPLYDRLDAVFPFCQLVSTHSMTLRVVTTNGPAPPAAGQTATRRVNPLSSERIIAGDRGAVETLSYRMLRPSGPNQVDPDMLSGTDDARLRAQVQPPPAQAATVR